MSIYAFASVPSPQSAGPAEWAASVITWEPDGLLAEDGESPMVWDLASGAQGYALMRGVRGFGMPPSVHHVDAGAAVPGSRWRGHVTAEREVFWPLRVTATGSGQAWADRDRQFWSTMRPDVTGWWRVAPPLDSTSRALKLRYRSVDDDGYDIDPRMRGRHIYGIHLAAEQPYWEGPAVTETWSAEQPPVLMFNSGTWPPIQINKASQMSTASLSNPGDLAAWPVWTITGPTTQAQVGVGTSLISVPFGLAAGESLTIDTRPTSRSAVMADGTKRTRELGGSSRFAEIPAGQSRRVQVSMTGTGKISVELTPLYWRAW